MPEKPSIAVLPFDNLSGDPEQDYIVDGISENIISALSHIPQLFVIDRDSSLTYKGKAVKVRQVIEELGAKYILGGSVLKSGNKVRITTQLIDALALDPEYAGAVTMLAWTHFNDARYGYTESRGESFKQAIELANLG